MASRKKPDPAALRTLGLFTGLTPLEEAEQMAREEGAIADKYQGEPRYAGDMIPSSLESAARWLGEGQQERGDDIRVIESGSGHAVLVLIRGDAPVHPYSTVNLRLSRRQWAKLKRIVDEAREPWPEDGMVSEVPQDAQRHIAPLDGRGEVRGEVSVAGREQLPFDEELAEVVPFPTDLVDDLPFSR